jgi:maltooligosyltrehalose trehalohydrolase
MWQLKQGANPQKKGVVFRVWAPQCKRVSLKLLDGHSKGIYPMNPHKGFFSYRAPKASNHDHYYFLLDNSRERPDPVSRFQPQGVHGPSEIFDHQGFRWTDRAWRGVFMKDMVIYELHVAAFTPEGNFEAASGKIPYLKKLGVNCVEVMPVNQYPGSRNWGYDGTGLFAVQNSYGGPAGFKGFVNACHKNKVAVCLDVVYNHLGPEGNYLAEFAPFFTSKYRTPWGNAVNLDDTDSKKVRRFFIDNALYWIHEFHVDALRIDAVHALFDRGPRHFLQELKTEVQKSARSLGRKVQVIAESELNDSQIVRPSQKGGYGLDSQWSDDFHHSIHRLLTGEHNGYYQDFSGLKSVAKALQDGFVFEGQYSKYRKKCYGNSSRDLLPEKFVVCLQNHDQIGNRAVGDRLTIQLSFEKEKLAAALLLLSPYVPLIFMGQEYGETAPFQYFIDHADPDLVNAVREGRKREFANFGWKSSLPDPKDESTFLRSKLDWGLLQKDGHKNLLRLYGDLAALRKSPPFKAGFNSKRRKVRFDEKDKWLSIEYPGRRSAGIIFSFSRQILKIPSPFGRSCGFKPLLYTEMREYGGALKLERKKRSDVLLEPYSAMAGEIHGR